MFRQMRPLLTQKPLCLFRYGSDHALREYMPDFEVVTASGTGYCAMSTSAAWLVPKGETKARTAPPDVVP